MADRPLTFHASPPAGHWINDPNGLVYADGAFRLFAQHRADAPAFKQTGWARFSSPDLLAWTFDGSVIPADGPAWAYSGCVDATANDLEAIHTVHEAGLERQVRRTSLNAGLSWSAAEPIVDLGPPARNRRDPFVFRDEEGWALLLAEPCDWTEWESSPPSRLRLYRSEDRRSWREAGFIGPWRPPGVIWEVPLLARIDGHTVLFVSEVDRRSGGASCSVRAWIGELQDTGFALANGAPPEGKLVDHGPDFYALMANVEKDWPLSDRAFVAWLSSWQSARVMSWPGFSGGPISIARTLSVQERAGSLRLAAHPHHDVVGRFTQRAANVPVAGLGRLRFAADKLKVTIRSSRGCIQINADWVSCAARIERTGDLGWSGDVRLGPRTGSGDELLLFVDGPVVELFLTGDGISASIALPTDDTFDISAEADAKPIALSWYEPNL